MEDVYPMIKNGRGSSLQNRGASEYFTSTQRANEGVD